MLRSQEDDHAAICPSSRLCMPCLFSPGRCHRLCEAAGMLLSFPGSACSGCANLRSGCLCKDKIEIAHQLLSVPLCNHRHKEQDLHAKQSDAHNGGSAE